MHWNLGRIYLHLKSNTKLTTLPTLCDTGKLDCSGHLGVLQGLNQLRKILTLIAVCVTLNVTLMFSFCRHINYK